MKAESFCPRKLRGLTQAQMASQLRVELAAYKKYERRSPLPHHLITPFCVIVDASEGYLLGGKIRAAKRPERRVDEIHDDRPHHRVPAAGRLR